MKIGISCYPTYGGSGVVATELGLALAARGHEIHFITYDQPVRLRTWPGRVYFHAVDVMDYPLFKYPPYTLAAASKIIEVVQTHDLDILHAHYAIPHTISALLARDVIGARLRIVTTLHGTDITLVGRDPSFFPMTRYGIQKSDAVTAVSEYLRRETVEQFGAEADIRVIPNFIDLDTYRPAHGEHQPCVRKHLAPNGERIVMHVSNFRPVKRVLDVVRAFEVIRGRMPAKLVMIGDGQDVGEARALSQSLGLGDDVTFLGRHDGIDSILPCADLFLLPSAHESFGLAALEALACGVPVISTRGSGVEEVVRDGVDGSLHAVGEARAMGEAGAAILGDDARLRTMRAAAREGAARFRTEDVVPQYEALYEEVLGAGRLHKTARP